MKTYRGDPYEKMMAHTYSGFLALRNQDYENALAAFRRALVADQDTRTETPEKKEDFVTAHYFAALCYHLLGEGENAAVQMTLAGKYARPSKLFDMEALNNANTFVLIGSGTGPLKVMSGPGGAIASFRQVPDPVQRIEMECDGKVLGDAAMTDELLVQATAQGLGDMDKIRIAKGVSKEALAQVPYASVGASLINAEADIRVWSFLPGKIYVWSGHLEPGLHTLALRCYAANGQRLPNCDQVWFYVPVSREKLNFLNFRMVPNRQNIADKVVVPCEALVEKKK
jgi:tetratricopeptide (TPR) repeat protein